jgi:KDO2-lipid IV(A) lauroyltransferase
MKQFVDVLVYWAVRATFWLLGLLPQSARVAIFATVFRVAFVVVPRLRRTIRINLAIAFPDKSEEWYREITRKNATEMGRLLADTVRLPRLDEAWVHSHVQIPILERYAKAQGTPGVLVATGHLGSFELLGHAIGLYGYPLSAVARKFKSKRLDTWWTGLREARGNTIIDRKGAFREICKCIDSGRSVAVLFDQNVKSKHAVFVDWFGKPAATTRAFALAAIKTKAPVFVASMKYLGGDNYRVAGVECDCRDIYADETLDDDVKVQRITEKISTIYCAMIEEFPEGWFWLHRRWKTRPPGEPERVY